MVTCITHKRCYQTKELAEEALIDARIRFDYSSGHGPVALYRCDDCGYYHLTSSGPMNERLADAINKGTVNKHKQAADWLRKIKK
jgi:hypothetical protein